MKVLLLHAYSADNRGDGLLVDATLDLVREACGPGADVTVVASRPRSFDHLGVRVVDSRPGRSGYGRDLRDVLRRIDEHDLVVGVGGGYLRAGHLSEAAKMLAVHGPQLRAAARSTAGSVYLPQSIGPLRFGTAPVVRAWLRRLDDVMVRDDRSAALVAGVGARRLPDLAVSTVPYEPHRDQAVDDVPVLSVRAVRGTVPGGALRVAGALPLFDGYVQSSVGANDDTAATAATRPRRVLAVDELMAPDVGPRRVVVAMRLHAALMALRAGHLVIHLAYERKGYGAFEDLGLDEYVHHAWRLDERRVVDQVSALVGSADARDAYVERLAPRVAAARAARAVMVQALRDAARDRPAVVREPR